MIFHTLVAQDETGYSTHIGSTFRQRDVRSYARIGTARQNRTRFQKELERGNVPAVVRILKTTVTESGIAWSEWVE